MELFSYARASKHRALSNCRRESVEPALKFHFNYGHTEELSLLMSKFGVLTRMGLKFDVIIFIFCLYLISQTTVASQRSGKDSKKRLDQCHGWEKDLRNNLSAPGNITDFLESLTESISTLNPGCVKSFSPNVSLSNLRKLMKVLNEEYDNLIPGTRKQIYKWVEAIYTKSGLYGMNTMEETNDKGPKGDPGKVKDQGKDKDKGKGKGNWITLDVLNILGRFIVQAPTSTFKSIAQGETSAICQLFNFSSDLLDKLFDLTPVQARILFKGLKACNINISEDTVIAKLGQLACFYPVNQVNSFNHRAVMTLQNKLLNCTRKIKEIYRKIVENVTVNQLTAGLIRELGSAVVGLKVSQVSNISKDAIAGALSELKDIKGWSKGQIKVLVKKYKESKNVTANELKKLGLLVSGLDAKTFSAFNGQDLLDAFSQKDVAKSPNGMLPVQKSSIVEAILGSVNIDSVLQSLPDLLVSKIPVEKLNKAQNINIDFLSQDKPWNLGQSVALINRVKSQLKKPEDIRKLKAAVKGIPCDLIDSLKADAVKALANNPHVSSNQIRCSARNFFAAKKVNYFSTLTEEDINEFLASYLTFEPNILDLKKIPQSLCSSIVELISQANLSMLPTNSERSISLFKYAKDCLKFTASSLTKEQGTNLGSLVCEFNNQDFKDLNNTVFLAIIPQLRQCGRFSEEKKNALREKILTTFSSISSWTVDELILLGDLLTVLKHDDFKKIPNDDDIKIALEQILSSHKPATNVPSDQFSSLYWKIFYILNKPKSNMKKRSTKCEEMLTFDKIEALGEANRMWTVAQLRCIETGDFVDSLDTLTVVTGFSIDQLEALKEKALEVYGKNINNEVLASLEKITLGFTDEEVKKYFTEPDIDTLGAISGYSKWASNDYSSRAKTILKNFMKGRAFSNLTSTDLVGLGYFLCAFSSDEIKDIDVAAYRSAARDIGSIMCPKTETLTALKERAVQAFSNVGNWTGAQLQEIGVVAAGLNAVEVRKLMTSTVSFLTPEAVSNFPPKVFSSMTVEQLRNLGPENYGAVTEAQKKALSPGQIDALKENIGIARSTSGAGSIYWNPVIMLTLLVLSLTAALH
ncbi:otoancorin-like isoform X2 [Hypanus sabinus]|uniref:otoancorin-like isoform X2 n=1 Tax=Hypanus sabinus TaxID=79690 RepID=UPI0028C4C30B|nr:otoancorin-like isoform X2 [Hypanus sabinus]XP_059813271.1 otoancorin-like isoform X2 [Hypanus sabinus]XP_059813272.1 otoancorin-like isoform X2 [Hypanus sabinus]